MIKKTIEITMPEEEWKWIENMITAKQGGGTAGEITQSEYFQRLHYFFLAHMDDWWKLGGLEHYEHKRKESK